MDFIQLASLLLQTYMLFLANPLFWLVLLLVTMQYRRTIAAETNFFGKAKVDIWHHMLFAVLSGLAGGLVASVLLVFFGISLVEIGIYYVWPLAILLLLINPRYLCFAYAGGIIGSFSALLHLFGNYWPFLLSGPLRGIADIHIPGLLALIGILHLTESFLIAISGHLFPSPLYIKTDQGVVGGFSLQKFWPLPLVGLLTATVPDPSAISSYTATMPDWWPIFASKSLPLAGHTLIYLLFPIVAGLGYGDLAISTPPRIKSKRSASNLAAYSMILLGAAFLAFHVPVFTLPVALFAFLGHEFLIINSNKKEFAQEPLYMPPSEGVRILDIFPKSPAWAAGLLPDDVILSVDDYDASDSMLLHALLQNASGKVLLEVERDGRRQKMILDYSAYKGDGTGIIPVPDRNAAAFVEAKQVHFFPMLLEKIRRLAKLFLRSLR